MKASLLLCALALLGATTATFKSYRGYQVLETPVLDEAAVKKMAPMAQHPEFDFWLEPRVGGKAQIMASAEDLPKLQRALEMMRLKSEVLVPDVGAVIEAERAEIEELRRKEKLEGRAPDLSRFLTFEEIQDYLSEVVAAYPSIASIINIGTSFEGRPMNVLKLSNGPGKSSIFIDVAIHAREWLGPPTILHVINELTENLVSNNNQAILDANDFYILPISNPDGYAYTWTNDRLWRKTRQPTGGTCRGSDPNRNFDQNWAGGGIPSTCSETYPGGAPWSEPETKAMSDFIAADPSITFALSVHTCGQYLLYPYGDTNALPPNVAQLESVGSEALAALAAIGGTQYELGSVANVLYFAYGSTTDWSYVKQNIVLSYTIELPCGGPNGFNPPVSLIAPVVTETWEAYKVFFSHIPATRG